MFAAAAFAALALALALADMLVAFFGGADRHLALADMCGKEADLLTSRATCAVPKYHR